MFVKNNPYGYKLNLNHPKIRELYYRYKEWKNISTNCPLSDAERFEFERYVIENFEKQGVPVPEWVKGEENKE